MEEAFSASCKRHGFAVLGPIAERRRHLVRDPVRWWREEHSADGEKNTARMARRTQRGWGEDHGHRQPGAVRER
jgi:hypothetical protein